MHQSHWVCERANFSLLNWDLCKNYSNTHIAYLNVWDGVSLRSFMHDAVELCWSHENISRNNNKWTMKTSWQIDERQSTARHGLVWPCMFYYLSCNWYLPYALLRIPRTTITATTIYLIKSIKIQNIMYTLCCLNACTPCAWCREQKAKIVPPFDHVALILSIRFLHSIE